jgi:hypothetical protein
MTPNPPTEGSANTDREALLKLCEDWLLWDSQGYALPLNDGVTQTDLMRRFVLELKRLLQGIPDSTEGTPLTDAEALKFGRILVTHGPEAGKTTEIIPSEFARQLERQLSERTQQSRKWAIEVEEKLIEIADLKTKLESQSPAVGDEVLQLLEQYDDKTLAAALSLIEQGKYPQPPAPQRAGVPDKQKGNSAEAFEKVWRRAFFDGSEHCGNKKNAIFWFIAGADFAIDELLTPPHGSTQGEWVSVNDQLPTGENEDALVLVYVPADKYMRIQFDNWGLRHETPVVGFPSIEIGKHWAEHEFEEITHWMPLPSPPTDKSE